MDPIQIFLVLAAVIVFGLWLYIRKNRQSKER